MNASKCCDCGLALLPKDCVAVPIAELEALRDARETFVIGFNSSRTGIAVAADAILSHLPPKVDHVAVLRDMREGWSAVDKNESGLGPQVAALEAAIAALEAKK